MALPEAWRFRKPQTECKNTDTPILERYLHMIFRKLSIDYNTGETEYFHVENNCACFHTGLYTRQYQAIYACFERNKKKDTTLKWYFTGFCDAVSSSNGRFLNRSSFFGSRSRFSGSLRMCSAFTRIGHSGLKFTPFCIIGKYGFLGSGSTYRLL